MDLIDDPPHTCTIQSSTNTADSAGGHSTSYTTEQTGVPCSINPTNSGTSTLFAQEQISHFEEIGFVTSALSVTLRRGWKVIGSDGYQYHLEGIKYGLAYDDCPALVYATGVALL